MDEGKGSLLVFLFILLCVIHLINVLDHINDIDGLFFNEFLTDCPVDPEPLLAKLAENDILGGLAIKENGKSGILWCVTEMNTKAEIDRMVSILKEAI